ncbi:hypothetical protein [Pelagerythrobacter marinus]|uniref:Ferrochelatase n=1 Tax=Pelagerythrobacter marinus TaxID=538382 RepID=A0ABW9UUK5_9SPHN|nr:hypothetical protein [Pelagerythrobacter marinus]MXO68544.1 hypothetical protein [Pelagerythrobacter marinus]USA40127.1 hypothetical protein NCF86_02930 [Pelagerythrobacter marinus]WPZ05750.1 hypothetical protein T8T98_09945 [Pelagerythrobacter marinus]
MKLRNFFFATAAASLAAAPVAAQAQAADRAAQPVAGESELAGSGISAGLIIAALAAIGMVILIVSEDDDEDPVSV